MPVRRPWPKSPNLPALAAVLAALAGALAALWWPIGRSGTASDGTGAAGIETTLLAESDSAPDTPETPATPVPVRTTTAVSTAAWWAPQPARATPMLTLAELLEVRAHLGTTPDPGGEFAHTGETMLFADAVQRLRQLKADRGDAAELQGVAHLLDEMLDPLVLRRDLPLREARTLKTELLLVLEPDLTTRQNMLVRWDVELARALGTAAR